MLYNQGCQYAMRLSLSFFDCAESSLLVAFGSQHSKELSLAILDLSERLQQANLPGLQESVPALSSLTVFYDPLEISKDSLAAKIEALCKEDRAAENRGRLWEIPVLYGGEAGPDLGDVAACAGLTQEQAIGLHSSQLYHVYMLGFAPGFAYLGDLPEVLRLPRRATPRARVPAGSVAIASDMTGVYPLESPGGWHLIGTAPVTLWDLSRMDEPLLKPGDRVRFKPVGQQEAAELRRRAGEGWMLRPSEEE
jgi:KipI family sensor histidine kinase inhibitor